MTLFQRRPRTVHAMKLLVPVVCFAFLVVATAAAAPPSPQLIATWTRTVSAKDVSRAHSTKIAPGTTWTLVITKRKSSLRSPGVAGYTGSVVPAAPTLVHMELGSDASDLYAWRLAGQSLILTKQHDPNADRTAILVGAWKRR
jgi:hypothetical protein